MDITITCKTCGKKFIFTNGEIAFYLEKKLSPPRHCPSCRKNGNAGLEEIRHKYGVKQSNIADNPQNHAGIAPISSPGVEDPDKRYSPSHYCNRYIRVETESEFYYLRVVYVGPNAYTFIYVKENDSASLFEEGFDKNLILENMKKQFYQFKGYKILMAPCSCDWLSIRMATLSKKIFCSSFGAHLEAQHRCQNSFEVKSRGYLTVLPYEESK